MRKCNDAFMIVTSQRGSRITGCLFLLDFLQRQSPWLWIAVIAVLFTKKIDSSDEKMQNL
jgi:hypothetical protein